MRARLAVASSGQQVALREIVLRNKPDAFLAASASATVPCLELEAGPLDESFDIMQWALAQSDPEGWLDMPGEGFDLIEQCDGPFKAALDRYKYPNRFEGVDPVEQRERASDILCDWGIRLSPYLFGDTPTLADMAILPFVRQFAHVDFDWFQEAQAGAVVNWLETFKSSDRFVSIMKKYPAWAPGDEITIFPDAS